MDNNTVEFVVYFVKKHLEHKKPTLFLLEIVERAIRETEEDGKTPERYELLKIWRNISKEVKYETKYVY